MHDNINPIYEPVMQEDTVYPLNDGQLLIVTEDSLEIGDVLGNLMLFCFSTFFKVIILFPFIKLLVRTSCDNLARWINLIL